MNPHEAEEIAEDLKGLACIECTKGWLGKHKGLTDPIQDINDVGVMGLIPPKLVKRLISEIEIIKKG